MAISTRFYYKQTDYIEQMNLLDDALSALTGNAADALTADGEQTITGGKTFADGALVLAGGTSGSLAVHAPAVAGTGAITLPATGTVLSTDDIVNDTVTGGATLPASAEAVKSLASTKADASAIKTLIPGNSVTIDEDETGLQLTLDTAQDLRTTASPTFASLVGTTAGVVRGAGKIGERPNSQTLATAMTTNVAKTVNTLVLQPGDWEIYGLIVVSTGSGTLTYYGAGISIVDNQLPADPGVTTVVRTATAPAVNPKMLVPSTQLINSTAKTVYLVAQAAFGTGCTIDGYLWARRMS